MRRLESYEKILVRCNYKYYIETYKMHLSHQLHYLPFNKFIISKCSHKLSDSWV